MTIFFEFLTAFLITLFISVFLVYPMGWRRESSAEGPLLSFFFIFFLLLFPIWLIGIWTIPLGPTLGEIYILPFLLAALLLSLLLLTLIPIKRGEAPDIEKETMAEEARLASSTAALSSLFWIFVGSALILTLLSYLFPES